jgi:hypothetical protein
MAALQSPEQVLNRRRQDHVLLEELNRSECPISVSGHHSVADARSGADPMPVGAGNPPRAYRATYEFDTLIGPGERHRPTVIVVDHLANGDYPAGEPVANVIGPAPWTPHFANGVPVCHGHRLWVPNRTQLVDYVIHVGRLLNFDEPRPAPGYSGYNAEAIAWWASELDYEPLDPSLEFPAIEPTEVLARRPARFAPAGAGQVAAAPRLRAAPSASRLIGAPAVRAGEPGPSRLRAAR